MNVVWLTPEIPYPPIGGRNGVFNRIVQLSKYNNIYLFSIAYSEGEKKQSFKMEKYCREVHYYNRNKEKLKVLIKSIFVPFSVASRTILQLRSDICNTLKKVKVDVVIVDFPNMAKNLKGIIPGDMYCTLNQHNIEYKRMRDMSKVKSISKLKRLAYFLESYRLERYEKKLYSSGILNSMTFFSKDDMELFLKKWNACEFSMRVFPLGANAVQSLCPKTHSKNLLFTGRLDNVAIPNVEAALWLAKEILPIIKKRIVDVKLILAGANPSDEIKDLQSEDVCVIPNYKELVDVYSLSDVVVLPLKSGGGVKGKLIEAAAFEKIIISTDRGYEGTNFIPGEHLLVGNTTDDFAQACIDALNNIDAYYTLATRAKSLFEREYEWKAICRRYNQFIYNEVSINRR